uniref:Uncharacterized protein n=1 Tax=Fagus sylvatica TaxID=28930 RepID=A0A2N9HLD5_FAGSY
MDRSPPDLSLYGGKTSIEEITRLHAPEKCRRRCSCAPAPSHLSKPRTGASQLRFEKMAPRPDPRMTITIWRWKRLHRRPHAPPRAGEAPATFSTRQHAEALRGTRGHAPGTRSCHSPFHRVSSYRHVNAT